MSSPRDTSKTPPEILLMGALGSGGTTALIEGMEAQGQQEMVASTTLPTDLRDPEAFEALGFKLGPVCPGDEMFREAELPEGWSREGSSHSMWSYIVDERGFRRVSIFYKAAFYDRNAHAGIIAMPETRAQSEAFDEMDKWAPYSDGWSSGRTKDGDNIVWTFKRRQRDENGKDIYDHDAHGWAWTNERRERVVAPNGSIVSEREWTED